jgi:hypothetical protein
MWTPGYWAYDPDHGYYWVPGTWVPAPQPGFLWTPGYWGWGGVAFIWHAGYWGPHVGFYGGVNYGFGYNGVGFVGGEWRGGHFFYNRAVTNFGGRHFDNVYYHPVTNNFAVNRVSYNGGRGGLQARPTAGEMAAEHDRHFEASSMQRQHELAARNDRAQFASENHGRPGIAATGRPGDFRTGAVAANRPGGSYSSASYHGANGVHVSGNPGGHGSYSSGGYHPATTVHQTAPAQHNEAWHGTSSSHQPSSHQPQPQEQSAHNSGGGGSPHGGVAPKHEGGESHGGESHHR